MDSAPTIETDDIKSFSFKDLFDKQSAQSVLISQTSAKDRISKLKSLKSALLLYQEDIRKAMFDTFSKPYIETDYSEILPVTRHIDHVCKNLSLWLQPQRRTTPIEFFGSNSYIQYEPKGVVLIISPWNYAFQLAFDPLVSAIAAGNCALIKPSEISPLASKLIKKIIAELFSPEEILVIEGDAEVAIELLKLPFDHIFFTGSTDIGKDVMRAASENLSSSYTRTGRIKSCNCTSGR
ncbi:MAG TPA: aldehyde dehydrogenase family protein [Saprospiraceae bacterium]|nr:aldehyde dehydrogenase family protein [Saprospiraceae bacterium]